MDRPEWWHWEVELTLHAIKRMSDRGFNEAEVPIVGRRKSSPIIADSADKQACEEPQPFR